MTIAAQDAGARTELVGNGTAGPFVSNFKIDDKSEVKVVVGSTTKVVDIDYTVTIGASTFSVTFLEPFPIVSENVILLRKQSSAQNTNYDPPIAQLERDLDDIKKLQQQILEIAGRSLKFSESSLKRSIDVEDPTDGKFLYYDQAVGKFKCATLMVAGTLPDPVTIAKGGTGGTTAATARTNLGLTNDATGRAAIGAAPLAPSYIVIGLSSELGNERALTAGAGIGISDAGAGGAVTISNTAGAAGYHYGLKASNNAGDATNDIDFPLGEASSDDAVAANRVLLAVGALTKQIDAVWAAGNAAGMRVGALADGTWHIYLFRRSNGTDDIFAQQSLAPTIPDGGTKKVRIMSLLREGGVMVPFNATRIGARAWQFIRKTAVLDVDITNPGTAAVTRTLSVAKDFKVSALFRALTHPAATNFKCLFTSFDENDQAPSDTVSPLSSMGATSQLSNFTGGHYQILTNTLGQIRSRFSLSGAGDVLRIATFGWIDWLE